MKPIFTLEYFCYFFYRDLVGSSDAQKDEAEEKEVEKEKQKWTVNVETLVVKTDLVIWIILNMILSLLLIVCELQVTDQLRNSLDRCWGSLSECQVTPIFFFRFLLVGLK